MHKAINLSIQYKNLRNGDKEGIMAYGKGAKSRSPI